MALYYVKDFTVISTDNSHPPDDCIKELHWGNPDTNAGFGGKYVWLVANTTQYRDDAGTYVEIDITDHPEGGQGDLAAGAGGKFRYAKIIKDHNVNEKITKIALYRKAKGDGPVSLDEANKLGFNRVSTDINKGRGGDWLQLIYGVEDEHWGGA